MSKHTLRLLLCGLSLLVLGSSLEAEARKHKPDGKKPPEASDAALDPLEKSPDKPAAEATDGDAAARRGAGAAPAATAPPSGKPASAPPSGKPASAPPSGKPASAPPSGKPPTSAAAPPPGAAPAPAEAPKELSPTATGPRQEAARAHFEKGVELYTNGDFPNAWLEFSSAYQIIPLVDLLNNLARCEVRMGRPRDALEHFRRFIATRPNDTDSVYIRQEIARLEGELGRGSTEPAVPETTTAAAPPPPRRVPVYGLMVGATTVAALIAGATTLGLVNSRFNALSTTCPQHDCLVEDAAVIERQSFAGYGLLGVGALGAALTGLTLYLELRTNKETMLRPLAGLGLHTPLGVIGRY